MFLDARSLCIMLAFRVARLLVSLTALAFSWLFTNLKSMFLPAAHDFTVA